MRKSIIASLASLILAVMFTVLWVTPAVAQSPKRGGHLKVGYALPPTSLDPVLGRSGGDAYYWRQMYDQLVEADSALRPQPENSLAESWEVPNPTTMVFHLRKGVQFHDGTPFNAEAVKFNIDRVLDANTKATPRAAFEVVQSVEVVDEYTVRFRLKNAWGAGLSMLADRGGAMNSPTAVRKHGDAYGFNISATGPFKLQEAVSGSHVHMVRNENYWNKDAMGNQLPYLDEVTIRIIKDASVLTAALKTGEIDLAYAPYKDVAEFKKNKNFRMNNFEGGSIGSMLVFNLGMAPTDDVNLRLAITHAVSAEAINQAVFFNGAIVAKAGMWPVGAWVYDPSVPRPHYDVAKAREYLKKSRYPDGVPVTLVTWTSPEHVPAAEIVKAQLEQIGIKTDIKVLSVGAATSQFFQDNAFNVYLTSWSRYPEPDWVASLSYKSDGYYNAANLKRPEMDRLIEQGASTYDIEERKAIYRKVNEIVLGEAWFVPLLYGVNYGTANKSVGNLETLFGWDAKMDVRRLWLNR